MRHLSLSCSLVLVAACAAPRVERNAIWDEMAAAPLSLGELEGLAPSVSGPLRIGIAPPIRRAALDEWGGLRLDHWTDAERVVIEKWGATLVEAGVLADLELLPSLLVECAAGQPVDMLAMRRAAARRNLDAIVVVRGVDAHASRANPLSLLYLTVIGLALVPGHSHVGVAALEAVAVDTRSGYLYAAATAEGDERRQLAPLNANPALLIDAARLEALDELGERLARELTD